MAVEIDPRYGRGSHHNWTEGGVAAQDVDNINRLADEAVDLPEGAYCEIGSEFNLVAHHPTQTLDERRAGFQAFTIAVATALRNRAPRVKRICSGTQGLWSNDDPDAWLTPEVLPLLDGIAADGYSKAFTAREKSMASMFDAPLAWATSKGLPFSVTEFGVEEHGDDGGAGKAQEYRDAQAWITANASTDGGATGLVHVMFNTSADGKASDGYDWPPDLTPLGETAFHDLVHGILP